MSAFSICWTCYTETGRGCDDGFGPQDLMLVGFGRSGVWLAVHLVEDDYRDEMFTVRAARTLDGPERKAIEGTQP
ncbi:hypothetical protein [Actinoplanes sp. NPDC049802]|uniref:hypothetical protein n=1 Tax=Actinoplanes sp. NPDC049802 TaxID=3154742 RepID=UPI0033DB367D